MFFFNKKINIENYTQSLANSNKIWCFKACLCRLTKKHWFMKRKSVIHEFRKEKSNKIYV